MKAEEEEAGYKGEALLSTVRRKPLEVATAGKRMMGERARLFNKF